VGDPAEVAQRLLEGEDVTGVTPAPEVRQLRTELLTRWPDLADDLMPWGADLAPRLSWSEGDFTSHFVAVTLRGQQGEEIESQVAPIARDLGLVGYNDILDELI
jgi:hypothetical protein